MWVKRYFWYLAICCSRSDDLFIPFAKCLQTAPLPPLLFSDIDLFHLEEKWQAEWNYTFNRVKKLSGEKWKFRYFTKYGIYCSGITENPFSWFNHLSSPESWNLTFIIMLFVIRCSHQIQFNHFPRKVVVQHVLDGSRTTGSVVLNT